MLKATKLLPTVEAKQILEYTGADVLEDAADVKNQQWLSPHLKNINGHAFIVAAHYSFAQHRPLELSPDMIWLLLNQMAAREVLSKPEKYRHVLSAHKEGKRTLVVRRDDFVVGSRDNDWPGVFTEFEQKIVDQAPSKLPATFSHPFSTSLAREITARRATLMKTASPFFKFEVMTLCGIPEIYLQGSLEDWKWIRRKAEDFKQLGMKRRIEALLPVLDQFVAAAEGKATPKFWCSFYKYNSESGGATITDWINLFFIEETNRLLHEVLKKDFSWTAPFVYKKGMSNAETKKFFRRKHLLSIKIGDYPQGLLEQEFIWNIGSPESGENKKMLLRAGFMGISQDPKTLVLKPQIAWQVQQLKEDLQKRNVRNFLRRSFWLNFNTASNILSYMDLDKEGAVVLKGRLAKRAENSEELWLKVLPMINHLFSVNFNAFFTEDLVRRTKAGGVEKINSSPTICRLLLSLPRVREVHIPANFDKECLAILQGRKDWKIKILEEPSTEGDGDPFAPVKE